MKNFGLIKNTYNNILSENIVNKEGKNRELFKTYLNEVKNNEILKTQFLIYKNIEDKIEENESKAKEFVKESISLMDKFDKQSIIEANNKLSSYISEKNFDDSYGDETKLRDLHENISNLILTVKSPNTIDAIVESTYGIVNYIMENKAIEVNEDLGIPNSILSSLAVDKFNEEYKDINESYKVAIKLVMDSSEEEKESFFNESVKECINLINENLETADITIKESLLSAKENLLNRNYNNESFVKDISKILELKEDLNN